MIVYLAARIFVALYGWDWPIVPVETRSVFTLFSMLEFVLATMFLGARFAMWIIERKERRAESK